LDALRTQVQGSHFCLLPVCADNLSWVRTLLSQASRSLPMPVVAVTHALKAVALRDLLMLGVADFIRVPGCYEELRVRVERVLAQSRTAQLDRLSSAPCDGAVRAYVMGRLVTRKSNRAVEMARAATPQPRHRQPIPVPHRDTAWQDSRAACQVLELEAFAAATAARYALDDAPFKQAKSRMVEDFEKAYLIAVLNRHGGNITHAAKAAQKHRRAFWELMRKHRIDISRPR